MVIRVFVKKQRTRTHTPTQQTRSLPGALKKGETFLHALANGNCHRAKNENKHMQSQEHQTGRSRDTRYVSIAWREEGPDGIGFSLHDNLVHQLLGYERPSPGSHTQGTVDRVGFQPQKRLHADETSLALLARRTNQKPMSGCQIGIHVVVKLTASWGI